MAQGRFLDILPLALPLPKAHTLTSPSGRIGFLTVRQLFHYLTMARWGLVICVLVIGVMVIVAVMTHHAIRTTPPGESTLWISQNLAQL